jgi:3-deoxy-D-manno-octulosonic-acid transferase
MELDDLYAGLADGTILINLLEIISSKSFRHYHKTPKFRAHAFENVSLALQFIKDEGLQLVNIGAEGT